MGEYRSHDEEIRSMLKQAQDKCDIALEDVVALEGKLQAALETIQRLRSAKVDEIEERESEVCRWRWDVMHQWNGDCGLHLGAIPYTLRYDDNGRNLNYCPKCAKPLEIVNEEDSDTYEQRMDAQRDLAEGQEDSDGS